MSTPLEVAEYSIALILQQVEAEIAKSALGIISVNISDKTVRGQCVQTIGINKNFDLWTVHETGTVDSTQNVYVHETGTVHDSCTVTVHDLAATVHETGTVTVHKSSHSIYSKDITKDNKDIHGAKAPKVQRANGVDFERFWEHWPIKRNKKKAKRLPGHDLET